MARRFLTLLLIVISNCQSPTLLVGQPGMRFRDVLKLSQGLQDRMIYDNAERNLPSMTGFAKYDEFRLSDGNVDILSLKQVKASVIVFNDKVIKIEAMSAPRPKTDQTLNELDRQIKIMTGELNGKGFQEIASENPVVLVHPEGLRVSIEIQHDAHNAWLKILFGHLAPKI